MVDVETGENWKASLTVTPTVLGFGLDPSHFTLSHDKNEITIHPSIAVAGVDLTFGFYGPRLRFGAKITNQSTRAIVVIVKNEDKSLTNI